jgi:outer membrane biosynthesis protein TonB
LPEKLALKWEDAVALTVWVGWKSAEKWNDEMMITRLGEVADVVPEEEPPSEEIAKTLMAVLKATEEGHGFAVYRGGDEPETKGAEEESADDEEEDAETTEPEEEEEEEEEEKPKKAKPKPKKAQAKAKPAKAKKGRPPKEKPPAKKKAPRFTRNKTYHAGLVVKKLGLDADEEELISELNDCYGVPNDDTSRACIRTARDVIRGYLGHES